MADALPRFMRERIDLNKLLRAMPSAPKPGECQYAPAMALVGVYVANAAITKLVAEGKLSLEAGTYFNSSLGVTAFNVLHACSHGAVSQHNPDHEAFENMVSRLAAVPLFLDDGWGRYHCQHHNRTNTEHDPDLYSTRFSLVNLGGYLSNFEDVDWPEVPKMYPGWEWRNQTLKMISYQVLHAAKIADPHFGRTLQATWRRAGDVAMVVIVLFFARYPHKNGTTGHENEVDSYYNTTYRGQAEVDLWMMGEGSHHLHHAKPDIPYTRLPRVGLELEERHPELKVAFRGITGLDDLSDGRLPEMLPPQEPPPDQRAWVTSCGIERSTRLLHSDPAGAIAGVAGAVGDSALDVCLKADVALLRSLHRRLGLGGREADKDAPLVKSGWCETVWSDGAKEELRGKAELVGAGIREAGRLVGAEFARTGEGSRPIARLDDIKGCYYQLFEAMARALVPRAAGAALLGHLSAALPRPAAGERRADPFHAFLESPLPRDMIRVVRGIRDGSQEQARQRAADLVASVRSRL